jgi:nitronate monooxygenase
MGTRFWATREALIHPAAKERVRTATGDETVRTQVYDIARQRAWPAAYTGRLLRNAFIETWHGHEDALRAHAAERGRAVAEADAAGDYDVANVTVGEAVGLIDDLPEAGDLVRRIAEAAEACLLHNAGRVAVR